MSEEMRVIARTWGYNREGVYHLLRSVHYPLPVVKRIKDWAIKNQINLLHRKYIDLPARSSSLQSDAAFTASNKLWRELQDEGYTSEDDQHAITFLFQLHEDNPELIDLSVAEKYLAQLEVMQDVEHKVS